METIMGVVIRERVTVDQHGAVVVVDARLHPGDEVEVTVHSVDTPRTASFLKAARATCIDAPVDYSVSFEDALRP
jgi:hypothetical protein